MLGDVHRVAQRIPDLARRIAGGEGVGGRKAKLVENNITHEGPPEVLAELGGHGQSEFGMLHPFSVSGLPFEFGRAI